MWRSSKPAFGVQSFHRNVEDRDSESYQMSFIKEVSDHFGRDIYQICLSLDLKDDNMGSFSKRFEDYIFETYPLFKKHCLESGMGLPLVYSSQNEYTDYWNPFIYSCFLELLKSQQKCKKDNLFCIVKKVMSFHKYLHVELLCPIIGEHNMDNILRFSCSLSLLSEQKIYEKNIPANTILGNNIMVMLNEWIFNSYDEVRQYLDPSVETPISFAEAFMYGPVKFTSIVVEVQNEAATLKIKPKQAYFMNIVANYNVPARYDWILKDPILQDNPLFVDQFLSPKFDEIMLDIPYVAEEHCSKNFRLDLDQSRALLAVEQSLRRKDSHRILQIHGPPGTGKTHTILAILENVFEHNPNSRVLVCSETNYALDMIARRIIEEKMIFEAEELQEPGPIYRLGSFKIDPFVERFKISKQKKHDQDNFLNASRCLAFTTMDSCIPKYVKHNPTRTQFDLIIVDDAQQVNEMEMLLLFFYECHNIVMFGDVQQLPPSVRSDQCLQTGYARSFFERYSNLIPDPYENYCVVLSTQHRMPMQIWEYSSKQFYNDMFKPPRNEYPSPGCRIPDLPMVTCFGFKYSPQIEHIDSRIFVSNLLEYLNDRIDGQHIKPPEIGIICFNYFQANGMKQKLAHFMYNGSNGKANIQIDIVEKFQGKQKDLIIINGPNTQKQANSITSNRWNVALTRARSAVIVLLNKYTVENDTNSHNLVSYYQQIGRFFEVSTCEQDFDNYLSN